MTRRYWLSICAMVFTAILGSWLVRAAAFAQLPQAAPERYGGFLIGLWLPIPVVQVAPSWIPFLCLTLVWAMLGILGWQAVRSLAGQERPRLWHVYAGFAAVSLALTFFSVTQSIDGYYYVLFGRLFGAYGIDPYSIAGPLRMQDSIFAQELPLLHNPPFPDPYGPGFTLVAGLVGRLETGVSLWTQLWTWRVVSSGACLLILVALARILRGASATERIRRLAIVAFHPLSLYESGAGGHNDFLMVAAAIWSYALVDEFPLVAGLLLGVAISIKYFAAIILPFVALKAARKSLVAAVLSVVLAALVPLLCFHPFAFAPTGATLARVGASLSMSLNWLLALPLFAIKAGDAAVRLVQQAIVAAFALVMLGAVIGFARAPRNALVFRCIAALLWSLPAMHPWYAAWLVPAAAARPPWATYAWWFGALSLLVYAHEAVLPTPVNHTIFIVIAIVLLALPIALARAPGNAAAPQGIAVQRDG